MPSSATESMRGVRISGEPVQPRSPYPMSSMKISTMFGRCGDVVVEVMGSSFQAGGLDGFDDLLLEDQEQCQGRDGGDGGARQDVVPGAGVLALQSADADLAHPFRFVVGGGLGAQEGGAGPAEDEDGQRREDPPPQRQRDPQVDPEDRKSTV